MPPPTPRRTDAAPRRPPAEAAAVRVFLRVQGIVQGVGFRPFVARLAAALELSGHVENTTRGVEIEVQGPGQEVEAFHRRLITSAPPIAQILAIETRELQPTREQGFQIRASRFDPVASAIIPPDIATCRACEAELADPSDRRFAYPFTNCTDCGPRYTIIRGIPYDRAQTTMAGFTMCSDCAAEYDDPASRRFHAQPNACPRCGPRLELLGARGEPLGGDPLAGAIETLAAGGLVALLGLGGFHLACDATDEGAVAELRRRKNRPAKPLAVMLPDLETARMLTHVHQAAAELLAGPRTPILLLPCRDAPGLPVAPSVAPGQDRLGIFLPYTPLHHMIFRQGGFRALVMTSGNRSDEPILATWGEAREKLVGVADRFVTHNRPILHRVDDSVVKHLSAAGPVVIRRARGYAPAPLPLPNPGDRPALAVGAELANTFCVARGNFVYLGPHVGDLKNLDTEEAFREGIDHLLGLLRVAPELVVCDLHPEYRSSRYAEEWRARGVEIVRVQHHEAHAAACMAEHSHWGDALALTLDGLGYGPDETLWGGELLAGRPGRFERLGHLAQVPQPGADKAAQEPWRMAASHLRRLQGSRWLETPLPAFRERGRHDLEILETLMERGVNAPLTSSCGRLFDAAAAVLGFTGSLRYSAQAPMEFESLAARCSSPARPYPCGEPAWSEGRLLLDPAPLVQALLEDALAETDQGEAALSFHAGLARLLALGTQEAACKTGLRHVFLSGGCLQNAVLTSHLSRELRALDLTPHSHREVPPNDGGISFGQVAWALGSAQE